jgi:hypothetical protein
MNKIITSKFFEDEIRTVPDTPKLFKIRECSFSEIRPIFEQNHYKHGHIGGGIFKNYALTFENNIWAGSVIGPPRHSGPYSDKGNLTVLEIRRMACLEEAPKNTESYFLSKIIWQLRKDKACDRVLSYSDESVGHTGTIYKAANFKCIGHTGDSIHVFWEGKRYHPRSLTIERPYSHRLRAAVKNGSATIEKMKPKSIWVYDL